MKKGKKKPEIRQLSNSRKKENSTFSAEFSLGTSIGLFCAAISHFENAKNEFFNRSTSFQFNMFVFVTFLCLGFLFLGIYFGKKGSTHSFKEPDL